MTMQIRVRYFASVREALGEMATLNWPDASAAPANVGALRDWLQARSPEHARVLDPARGLRAALNQAFCHDDDALADGDEVAFFPPVTGG